MTIKEFLLKHTEKGELCVIKQDGYILEIAYILLDCEDFFDIRPNLENKKVKSDRWGCLEITTKKGSKKKIPCHYIEI